MKTARACWSTMDCLSWFFFVREVGLEGEGGVVMMFIRCDLFFL